MRTWNNFVGPYTCRMNEFKLRIFFLKAVLFGFCQSPFQVQGEVTAVLFIPM